ncbi:hypothetical protein C5748_23025 [Phyllobacterium phragmitis]|uniref:VCBS repeat-containing protein n=1 Tax=Phyllobacterium phragmitis TaxID=2670329 RepID=A0A2S9IKU8_9HYPH|nr:hypothetical protein C5748_23025 [Phyllobacterium phragmitis]
MQDVTGDGIADFVYGNNANAAILVLAGKADGTFDTTQIITTDMSSFNYWTGGAGVGNVGRSTFLQDTNDDGILDWVNLNDDGSSRENSLIFLGNGNGTFSTTPIEGGYDLSDTGWIGGANNLFGHVGAKDGSAAAASPAANADPSPMMQSAIETSDHDATSSDISHSLPKHGGTDSSHSMVWSGHVEAEPLSLSGEGIYLDLTRIDGTNIRDTGTVDITGNGSNTLTLNAEDVKGLLEDGHQDVFKVMADADDKVEAKGFTDTGQTTTEQDVAYHIYESSDGTHLWVEDDAHVDV